MGRTRLTPEQRRHQLLEIGTRLFAENPYEEVWIEEVAELAGVSRGLMYHYFPTKRDFYAAVIRAQSEWLLREQQKAIDPAQPLVEQLRAGMDVYLDFIEQNPASYRALYRGMLSADEEIRSILDTGHTLQAANLLAALGLADNPLARLAVRSWLTFVVTASVDWQDNAEVTRSQVRDLCVDTLLHLSHLATTK